MYREDILQVEEVELESFPTSLPPTPFKRELTNRLVRYFVAYKLSSSCDQSQGPLQGRIKPETMSICGRILKGILHFIRYRFSQPALGSHLIVGYIGIWFMTDEAHVTSIAVKKEYRRTGVGELMMLRGIKAAIDRKSRLMTLEVRVSNYGAHALYKKYGYREVGVRKRYYLDNGEDALIMTTDLIMSAEYQAFYDDRVRAFSKDCFDIIEDE
jgi:ribosomal-protein-alanine N-acetyltransferase